MKAVLLFSGGLDSTTLLTLLFRKYQAETVLALTARYGSTHERMETEAADKIVDWFQRHLYDVESEVIKLPDVFRGGHSALLSEGVIPARPYEDGPQPTVVPFRNGVLVASAVALAQARGFDSVWIAVHSNDASHWAYPDTSPEFVGGMTSAAYAGTMHEVRLNAPFMWMSKADIVRIAAEYRAPLGLSYSCYRGGPYHCGKCPTCLERLAAFEESLYVDPALYDPEIEVTGSVKWPSTEEPWTK